MKPPLFLFIALCIWLNINLISAQTHPSDATVCKGGSAVFAIASQSGYSYQWQVYDGSVWRSLSNGTTVSGATTPTLTLSNCLVSHNGTPFRCRKTYFSNTTYTDPAYLFVRGIVNQPSDKSICSGSSAVFSVSATPAGTRTYQWQRSTNSIQWYNITSAGSSPGYSGWTSASLTVSNPPSTYYFRCVVSYSDAPTCQETSNVARFYNASAPYISTHPSNTNVCLNGSGSFSVTVNEPGVTYQWQRKRWLEGIPPVPGMWQYTTLTNGGTNPTYSGVTSKTLTISGVTLSGDDEDGFVCNVTNCNGTTMSNMAWHTVINPPAMVTQPVNRRICAGSGTTFSVLASGAGISYRWQVSTNGGSSWSNISSAGSGPVYSGWTTATLTLSSTVAGNNGYRYRCYITGTCSPAIYSNEVTLTVDPSVALISSQSSNVTVCAGGSASFSVTAADVGQTYQWAVSTNGGSSWTNITSGGSNPAYSGWSSNTLNLTNTVAGNNAYRYRCTLTNACGSAASNQRILTVDTPLEITQTPVDASVCEAVTANFTYTANGTITGQKWQVSTNGGTNWSDISPSTPSPPEYSGYSTSTLQVLEAVYANNGYKYRSVINGSTLCSPPTSYTSSAVTLTVKELTYIDTQPQDANVCNNANHTFSVTVRGTDLTYQWQVSTNNGANWSPIIEAGTNPSYSGWTTNELTLNKVILANDLNQYRCIISSSCSSPVTSAIAVLYLHPNPVVSLGEDKHFCPGSPITLDAGSGFSAYLWNTGEDTRTIDVSEAGEYSVEVTDANGCKNSSQLSVIADELLPDLDLGDDQTVCKYTYVILDATDEYDFYLWNDASTNRKLTVYNSGEYWVEAGRNNTVCRTSDTVSVTVMEPYEDEEICMVLIDPDTEKNLIVWEKTEGVNTMKYQVLKKTGTIYTLVGERMFADSSWVIDYNSNPASQAEAYVLVTIDNCGNASEMSKWHKPFLLQSSLGFDVINLSWEPYLVNGFEELAPGVHIFTNIDIFRGTSSAELDKIGSITAGIGSTSYIDTDPPADVKLFYRIGGEKDPPCNPNNLPLKKASAGPFVHSFSNLEDNQRITGTGYKNTGDVMTMYPNPMSDIAIIRMEGNHVFPLHLRLTDLSGRVLREQMVYENEILLHRENLRPGSYIVEIRGEKRYRGMLLVQ